MLLRLFVMFLIFISTGVNAFSQVDLSFFSDTVQKGQHANAIVVTHHREFIYVGGQGLSVSNFNLAPTITKLDTSGKTIWTYSTNKEFDQEDSYFGGIVYGNAYITKLIFDSNYLYAVCYVPQVNQHQLWKLNESNGDLVWKKSIPGVIDLKIANTDYLVFSYNSGYTDCIYNLVSKVTGKTVFSKIISAYAESSHDCNFHFEPDGTSYIIKKDSIIKYSSPDLSTMIWKKKVISSGYISQIKIEPDGYLYYAGNQGVLLSGRIDKATGNPGWNSIATYPSASLNDDVSDFKIVGDYVYVSGNHRGYGSLFTAYRMWKINRSTGATSWQIVYNPQWTNAPTTNAGYASTNSFDLDANGNIYLSGYEYGNDYRSGVWGICKFDSNGTRVYHATVFDGAPYISLHNRGAYSFLNNNRIFHIGNIQLTPGLGAETNVYLVATDTSSIFNPYVKKKTQSFYQYFSDAKTIANFSNSKYVVFKQLGKSAVLEMRNSINNDIIWTRTITGTFNYRADKMSVMQNKRISIDILCSPTGGYYPIQFDYKTKPDSIYFLTFDSVGTIVKQKKIYSGGVNKDFKTLQLYTDTCTALIYTGTDAWGRPNSIQVYNPYNATQNIGGSYDLVNASYQPSIANQDYFLRFAADSAAYVWNSYNFSSSQLPVYQVYKFNITSQSGASAVIYKSVGHDILVSNQAICDSISILLVGKSYSGLPDIVRYNRRTYSVMWAKPENSNHIIDVTGSSLNHVYWSGRKSNNLIIRQLNKNTGSTVWEKNIDPPGTNQFYFPVAQKFNEIRGQLSVSGFITDSSIVLPSQKPFYLIVDTLGNVISQWIGTPDLSQKNSLKTIEISQLGQTLFGGAYYKNPYGRSGVIIAADKPLAADLIIAGVALNNVTVPQGQNLGINFSLKNIGTKNAGNHRTFFYLSPDHILTPNANNDLLIGNYEVTEEIGINQTSNQFYQNLPIPANLAIGNYYLFVVTNADSSILELNRSNNDFSTQVNISITTGIVLMDNSQFIKLSPNPAKNYLQLNFKIQNIHRLNAELIDINGRIINNWQNLKNGSQINISQLSKAVYFIRLYSIDQKTNALLKIIKE